MPRMIASFACSCSWALRDGPRRVQFQCHCACTVKTIKPLNPGQCSVTATVCTPTTVRVQVPANSKCKAAAVTNVHSAAADRIWRVCLADNSPNAVVDLCSRALCSARTPQWLEKPVLVYRPPSIPLQTSRSQQGTQCTYTHLCTIRDRVTDNRPKSLLSLLPSIVQ